MEQVEETPRGEALVFAVIALDLEVVANVGDPHSLFLVLRKTGDGDRVFVFVLPFICPPKKLTSTPHHVGQQRRVLLTIRERRSYFCPSSWLAKSMLQQQLKDTHTNLVTYPSVPVK